MESTKGLISGDPSPFLASTKWFTDLVYPHTMMYLICKVGIIPPAIGKLESQALI